MREGRSLLVLRIAYVLALVWAGGGLAGVSLVSPDFDLAEGDRQNTLTWRDLQPEKLVSVVGEFTTFPWTGKAQIGLSGLYTGRCDWSYVIRAAVTPDSAYLTWSEVVNWRTLSTKPARISVLETDQDYPLSDGLKIMIKSAGLFDFDPVDWSAPEPRFHGIYALRDTIPGGAVRHDFSCTSGGELTQQAGPGISLAWQNSLGGAGTISVSRAGEDALVQAGLKVSFSAGSYQAGQSFSLRAWPPLNDAEQFKAKASTFDGYLVLRHSVEDRSGPDPDSIYSYKVVANFNKCLDPGFFEDSNGQADPGGTRTFIDKGVRGGPGVAPDSLARVVLNGFPYDYAVVAYDWREDYKLDMSPIVWKRAYPGVEPPDLDAANPSRRVYAVPNPYTFHADWEEGQARLQFVNVPSDAQIKIFDASGGYIITVAPNQKRDGSALGTADWFLRDSDGKDVVSGIYIFRVESKTGAQTGRFIVIR